jgi:hypothetical protein
MTMPGHRSWSPGTPDFPYDTVLRVWITADGKMHFKFNETLLMDVCPPALRAAILDGIKQAVTEAEGEMLPKEAVPQ